MSEFVILIWGILTMILGFLLVFLMKKQKRKLEKYWMIYKLVLIVLSFLVSAVAYYFLVDSPHVIWVVRLGILLLGTLNVWILYRRPWPVRNAFKFEEDAFWPEFVFVLLGGLLVSIAFATTPQTLGIIDYSVNVSETFWDGPIVFLLPFLVFKMSDISSQVPFKIVENPWVFPLERINASEWPMRELMQVNFEVKRSLLDEYNLFSWWAKPWIEAPKEVNLGQAFQLAMQERRRKSELVSIQDLGDEYDGPPRFVWIFSFKKVWYNPMTWFRNPRYINPDLSIKQNDIQKGDVIVARRVPGDGSTPVNRDYGQYTSGDDNDKTVLIKR